MGESHVSFAGRCWLPTTSGQKDNTLSSAKRGHGTSSHIQPAPPQSYHRKDGGALVEKGN